MSSSQQAYALTQTQKDHFLQHGYIHLTNCFTHDQAADMTKDVWTRLGMSPVDKTTWTQARVNMPSHRVFDLRVFAPKVWDAICELCGGEERVSDISWQWRDSLIINLGTTDGEGKPAKPPQMLKGWHVDGDFFVHYLDSPEQGLLVIPLFSDVPENGGGTMICPDSIHVVARWMYDHPDGVSPRMVPRDHPDFTTEKNLEWYNDLASRSDNFVEAKGQVGDVYLLHPLMMHSAASNPLRNVRIITNPPVSLKDPHCFDREDGSYSLVEMKTRQSLGGEDMLKGWRITMPREKVIPERVRIQEAMKRDEMERMEEARTVSAAAAA